MWIVQNIKQYLTNQRVAHKIHSLSPFHTLDQVASSTQLPPGMYVKPAMLFDEFGLIMAVIPVGHQVNLLALKKQLKRNLQPLDQARHTHIFKGVLPSFTPPLGAAYGIKTIVDDEIMLHKSIYFCIGDNVHVAEMDTQNFNLLQQNATLVSNITKPESAAETNETTAPVPNSSSLQQRLAGLEKLPAMPEMARKLLILKNSPYAHVTELAEIIGQDPSLSLQTIHYANSPLYGFSNKVHDLNQAIQILGFDMVLHLTLGIAMGRGFKIPKQSPFDLQGFWRHSVTSASLAQTLNRLLPKEKRIPHGACYLAGLLHNFGQLLIGQLFPEDFATVHKIAAEQPDRPLEEIETKLLGYHHGEICAQLMESWAITEELTTVTREHHNYQYNGSDANLVRLIQLGDLLLAEAGIMTNSRNDQELMAQLCFALHLDEKKVAETAKQFLEEASSLNGIALQLAA